MTNTPSTSSTDTRSSLTPSDLVERYFDAWLAKDIDRLAEVTHEQVTFHGPLAQLKGKNDVLNGLKGLAAATENLTIDKRLANDTDVITWFTLDVDGASGLQVANWTETADGKIAHIHVTFDPRSLLG